MQIHLQLVGHTHNKEMLLLWTNRCKNLRQLRQVLPRLKKLISMVMMVIKIMAKANKSFHFCFVEVDNAVLSEINILVSVSCGDNCSISITAH